MHEAEGIRHAPSVGEAAALERLVEVALLEDLGPACRDLAAVAVQGAHMEFLMVARRPGVICGLHAAAHVFRRCGAHQVVTEGDDGEAVVAGGVVMRVAGDAAAILMAERTALNFVQQLSGVATLTRAFVDAVTGTGVQVLDTRKTIPGMRAAQRWAVRCGGGHNHRFGLHDEAMVKDNHIAACGGITEAVGRIRRAHPGMRIHVEADAPRDAAEAADAGADVVLLDNMPLEALRESHALVAGRCMTEASGGIDLSTAGAIAAAGVDRISVGALTHSAPALDIGLDPAVFPGAT